MRGLSLLLLPAALMAQRSALPPAEAFDRELKKNRFGTWLVLEDEGAAWGAAMRAALEGDALLALNLPLKVVSGGKKPDALEATLRERFGWAKGAHWALLDAKGRVLEEGAAAPTAQSLTSAVEHAGIRSRAQELEDFLRRHPDHMEAQVALLRERLMLANRRTRKVLGTAPVRPEGAAPEAPRKLDPENDLKIWSPVVQQLDRLLQGAWVEAGPNLGVMVGMSAAELSPAMGALLTRHKVEIEEALRRRPNAADPWLMWLSASRKCGGWSLASLLQTLQPLPGTLPGEWPPAMALEEFLKDAMTRRDWMAIREVLEPRWESIRTGDYRWMGGQAIWESLVAPLLEAQLSMGDVGAADQLMGEMNALDGWQGLASRARDLATRLNRPDLAARWGALTPKGR